MRGSHTSRTRKKVLLCQRLPRDLSKRKIKISNFKCQSTQFRQVPAYAYVAIIFVLGFLIFADHQQPLKVVGMLIRLWAVHKRRHQCFKIFDPPPSFVIIFTTVL